MMENLKKYTYGQVLKFSVNPFNEKVEITLDTTEASKVKIAQVQIEVTAYAQTKCVLNNNLFRFDIGTISLNQGHPSYVSSKAFRISTYNNVMLTSSSIPGWYHYMDLNQMICKLKEFQHHQHYMLYLQFHLHIQWLNILQFNL